MVPMTKFSCVARMSLIYYFNRHGERKVAKRPRKEFSSAKNHESESSDDEQDKANPYWSVDSRLYKDQLKEKWKEDKSEGDDDDEEIEEEMEQSGSEEEVREVTKQVNGDAAQARAEKLQ
ncbi:hypothetical protein OS493_035812, partial [Desmophyllum pertusum]